MNQIISPWEGWEIVRVIGKGSFGKVYEIQRSAFGFRESAAMKVLTIPADEFQVENMRAEGMDEKSITQTLHGYVGDIVREYRLMLGLRNCPNIVHCDDLQVTKLQDRLGWNVYIKMELLKPLMQILDQVSNEEQIIKLAKDLCYALVTCQNHTILHRDIKPHNIFLADDGNYKLGDFGISRNLDHTTYATVGVGTFNYMAPEVLNGDTYGPQADIYSLGMVLYWLLNRRRQPFLPLPPENYTSSMAEEARRRRFRGEPLPVPADGCNELQRIVLKACAFRPQSRFASAQDMLNALNDLSTCSYEETTLINRSEVLENETFQVNPIQENLEKMYHLLFNVNQVDNAHTDSYPDEDVPECEEDDNVVIDFNTLKSIFLSKKFLIGVAFTIVAAVLLVVLIFFILFIMII